MKSAADKSAYIQNDLSRREYLGESMPDFGSNVIANLLFRTHISISIINRITFEWQR